MLAEAIPLPSDGVVGRLTPEQEEKLKEFWKELLRLVDKAPLEGGTKGAFSTTVDDTGENIPKDDNAKERLKREQETHDAEAAFQEFGSIEFMACFWRYILMDDPDVMALKFLRARKWQVTAGVAMMCACMRWRMTSDVESIFKKGEEGMKDAEGFLMQMEIGKTYTQGTDRFGRPVCYIHVAKHRTFDQSPKALEDFVLFQMESIRCLCAPPVEKIIMVFDMTGFGIRNMDWRCILFIVKCLEAYYPEGLHLMCIHSAPWVFHGIWKILGPMLDPVVRRKIVMTKTTDDLLVHIPKNHLVKQLGGSSGWKWEYPPIVTGENAPQSDTSGLEAAQRDRDRLTKAHVAATRKWVATDANSKEGRRAALKRRLATLEMRAQYFILDPFIRGRGAYHRNGNIVGNGLVTFEYPSEPGERVESEWEVAGYEGCREAALVEIELLKRQLKDTKKPE